MDLAEKPDDEILSVADPIMDNLMDASTAIDHARHVRDFTERAKSVVTPEHLQRVCQQYQSEKGFFSKREFVAIFRRPHSVVLSGDNGLLRHQVNMSRSYFWLKMTTGTS